jgi:hypothetical protein
MNSESGSFFFIGPVLVIIALVVIAPVYLGFLIFAAIRCARWCPEKDRTAWMLITIFVPFGWLFYLTIGPRRAPDSVGLQASAPGL